MRAQRQRHPQRDTLQDKVGKAIICFVLFGIFLHIAPIVLYLFGINF